MVRFGRAWRASLGTWQQYSRLRFAARIIAWLFGVAATLALSLRIVPPAWQWALDHRSGEFLELLIRLGIVAGGITGIVVAFRTPSGLMQKVGTILGFAFLGIVAAFLISFIFSLIAALIAAAAMIVVAGLGGATVGVLAAFTLVLIVSTGVFFWKLCTD